MTRHLWIEFQRRAAHSPLSALEYQVHLLNILATDKSSNEEGWAEVLNIKNLDIVCDDTDLEGNLMWKFQIKQVQSDRIDLGLFQINFGITT